MLQLIFETERENREKSLYWDSRLIFFSSPHQSGDVPNALATCGRGRGQGLLGPNVQICSWCPCQERPLVQASEIATEKQKQSQGVLLLLYKSQSSVLIFAAPYYYMEINESFAIKFTPL